MENNIQTVNNGDLYKAINKFNWGAFWFPILWGLGNGCFKKTFIPLFIICCISLSCNFSLGLLGGLSFGPFGLIFGSLAAYFIAFCAGIAQFGFLIYFGIKGNLWAYEGRAWGSLQDFEDTQRRWGIAVAVFFFGSLVIVGICLALIIMGAFAAVVLQKPY